MFGKKIINKMAVWDTVKKYKKSLDNLQKRYIPLERI
jgi:hypothetical protein